MSWLAFPVVVGALMAAAAWASAALLFPAWTALTRRAPALARAIPFITALPLVVAWVLGAAAVLPGDPHLDQPFGCHCAASMPMWSHLCPVHPRESVGFLPVAMVVLALWLPARLRSLGVLVREPIGVGDGTEAPVLVELPQPTVRLVGWLRPVIVVDPRFWDVLSSPERDAVLAHERAHLHRGDPSLLMALRVLTLAAPRRAVTPLLRAWLDHAELRADARAAHELGDPVVVAAALVRCARMGVATASGAPGWTGGSLERRVKRLLADGGGPASSAPDVGLVDVAALAAVMSLAFSTTRWVHHHLEHLLNLSF